MVEYNWEENKWSFIIENSNYSEVLDIISGKLAKDNTCKITIEKVGCLGIINMSDFEED